MSIAHATLEKWIKEFAGEGLLIPKVPSRIGTITDFVKRVRTVLWGIDQDQYNRWIDRIENLKSMGYQIHEAQVRAAKEFPACRPFFREYDIKQFDRDSGSHPDIVFFGDERRSRQIVSEGRDMSYRENLRWAAMAAGQHLRTGDEFYDVPNDTAFYLYQQALGDPKDFMTKLGTMEGREDMESMLEKSTRKVADRAVGEIDKWLNDLSGKVECDGEEEAEASRELLFQGLVEGVEPQRQESCDD